MTPWVRNVAAAGRGSPAACAATHRARVPHGRDEATRARPPDRAGGPEGSPTSGRVVYKNGLPGETAVQKLDTRDPSFAEAWARVCARGSDEDEAPVREAAHVIVQDVRARGDAAVLEYTRRFDGWEPGGPEGLVREGRVPRGLRRPAGGGPACAQARREADRGLPPPRARRRGAGEARRDRRDARPGGPAARARRPLRAGRHGALPVVGAHDGDPGEGGGRAGRTSARPA